MEEKSAEEIIERHYRIYGRVQMVLFRDSASRKAGKLGIVGFVQNMADGSVLVVAQGTLRQLDAYKNFLIKGPPFGKVDNIEMEDSPKTAEFSSFDIHYG